MKTLKKTSLVFAIMLTLSIVVQAQTMIKGNIKSLEKEELLIGATIQIKETSEGTVSDVDGEFLFSTQQTLPITLVFSFIGYTSKEVYYNGNEFLEILLEDAPLIGQEVIISASRRAEKASNAPASISILDNRKIGNQALFHPAQALRNLHGVDVTQQGIDQFQINLRGRLDAFNTETYIMQDYRSLIVPGQGQVVMSRTGVNELDLDRIEVVRGPGSALYGPGVETGVVHFITKSPFSYPGTSLSLGTGTKANLSVAARHAGLISDKLGYKIVTHYNRANDFILDPNDPTDAESLAAFQPQVTSGLTGEVLRTTNELENQISNFNLVGALEFRPSTKTIVHATAGYTYRRGIVRASLGEALQDNPNYFGQVRLESGGFFAQVYVNGAKSEKENGVLYRTGRTSVGNNQGWQAQAQYDWKLLNETLDFTIGGEVQSIISKTQGTVHGRFEDDDDNNTFSVYAQAKWNIAPTLDVIAAARMDRFSAIDETTISPRAGIIFKPTPAHTFRATFNRSITQPSSLFIYADLLFGISPVFDIPFLGGNQPITFSDPLQTSSFLGGTYEGIDMPLAIPYNIALSSLQEAFPQPVINYLQSKIAEITGTSAGVLLVNGQPTTVLPERDLIRSTKTNAYEIGYKGIFGGTVAVGIDVYYNKRKDLIFTESVSPLVINPNLATDLATELERVTDPAVLADLGLPQDAVIGAFSAVGAALAENPLGLVSPDVPYASDRPQFIVTPSNTGNVNYFGADLSLQYYFNEELSAFANYSWLDQIFFEDEDIGLPGTGQVYSLNTPKNRIRLGVDYIPEKQGFSYTASMRYQDAMEVSNGTIFSGPIDSYTIVDAGFGYRFNSGVKVNVTAQNLFNQEYRIMPKMPKIGRLVLVKGVVEF